MKKDYKGFELGPIRPPSEAESLLLRVARNCSWNKCKFCALFKGTKFSTRPKEDVCKDIDLIKKNIDFLQKTSKLKESEKKSIISEYFGQLSKDEQWAFYSADSWIQNGMESVFLQDANSLVIKSNDLIHILKHFKEAFPHKKRITSYARSQTIIKIPDEKLQEIAEAGLTRIHIGMESANDTILELIKKGVTKAVHIEAGKKVKRAGIELSEYYMPGVGGVEYSTQNAIDSADALNQINPDFIRIRSLAVKDDQELFDDYQNGTFTRTDDVAVVKEILLFIQSLNDIDSTIKSDHILNLLPEVEGSVKCDKEKMIQQLMNFLSLNRKEQMIYQIGRRVGYMKDLKDLRDETRRRATLFVMEDENISEKNINEFIEQRLNQFI